MFDLSSQLETLEELREYRSEYDNLPRTKAGAPPNSFFLQNGMFGSVDAELLWAMIRWIEPSRIVEVGSGWTTALMSQAVSRNGVECDIKTIDPNPPGQAYNRQSVTLFNRRLQDVGDVFGGLTEDDMIVVDSSHKFVTDGEIDLVLRALPGLSGVYVMFHDIFLPADYPAQWSERGYNEQEHLEAYLASHPEDAVLVGANFLHIEEPQALKDSFASYDPNRPIGPGALWFKTSIKESARTIAAEEPPELEDIEDDPTEDHDAPEVATSDTLSALL